MDCSISKTLNIYRLLIRKSDINFPRYNFPFFIAQRNYFNYFLSVTIAFPSHNVELLYNYRNIVLRDLVGGNYFL